MNQRILIAGCGDIGSRLGQILAQNNHDVWALRRHTDLLPPEFHPIGSDLSKPIAAELLPKNLSAVYFTAAATERSDANYKQTYVNGVTHLISALRNQPQIRRFIFISSTSVYGEQDGHWVDEQAPTHPSHFTGKRMLEAENQVHLSPWESCCVRFGGIYGPGRSRLLERAYCGQAKLKDTQSAPYYTNRIHQDDCAGILAHLLDTPVLPPLVNGVDDTPAPYNTVMQWLANELGTTLTTESGSSSKSANKRCNNDKLKELGYSLLFPSFQDGYRPMIDSLLNESSDQPAEL